MSEYPPFVGNLEAHRKFVDTYPAFCDALPRISEITNRILSSCVVEDPDENNRATNIILRELAVLICEDFDEVVLLCANGHPRGGLKILRGMFERSVTLFEIDENPLAARLFHDYNYVDRYKLATQIEGSYPKTFTPEKLKEIKDARDEVIDKYMGECPKCHAPRPNPSWMKGGIVDIAKKRGFPCSVFIHAYYNALNETHPKMEAIYYRRRMDGQEPDVDDERATLLIAHLILIESIRVLAEHFQLNDLKELYQQNRQELGRIWPAKEILAKE